jgi:hypothetical protein
VAAFRVVYPDGSTDELDGSEGPAVGDVLSAGSQPLVVRYVQRKDGRTVAYLDPDHDNLTMRKMSTFVVDGVELRLSLAETAELADRVRRFSYGDPGHPATAVAARLEQLVEEDAETRADLLDSEKSMLRLAIEDWLVQLGAQGLPQRVMRLRLALHGEGSR